MISLEKQFEAELIYKMQRAKKECKYNPTRFNQMLVQHGATETAKRLIRNGIETGHTSDGFATLCICGRTDLSMEASVCNPKYHQLFSQEEIKYCSELLGNK